MSWNAAHMGVSHTPIKLLVHERWLAVKVLMEVMVGHNIDFRQVSSTVRRVYSVTSYSSETITHLDGMANIF